MLRQKINNLYSRYFDPEIILTKEYLAFLGTPKQLYFQWLDGNQTDLDAWNAEIERAMDLARQEKQRCQKQKIYLPWNDFKTVIESFFRKIFENCKLTEEFETDQDPQILYDFINEDNFYVKYFCKSLENYMKNYHIEYFGLKRGRNKKYTSCKLCGTLIEKTNNRILFCPACAKEQNRIKSREKMRYIRKV